MKRPSLSGILRSWGLGCLAGTVYLSTVTFIRINTQGVFIAFENNPVILAVESFIVIPSAWIYLFFLTYNHLWKRGEKK